MDAKRVGYLLYYLKKMDWQQYRRFLRYASAKSKRSRLILIGESFRDSLKYNVSPTEYFQFGFYQKKSAEKRLWAGTGFMYEYQLKMNPKGSRSVLEDKRAFYKEYQPFFKHRLFTKQEILSKPELWDELKRHASGKVVLKAADGQCGRQVKIVKTEGLGLQELLDLMDGEYNMLEEFLVQHHKLQSLAPRAVNTVRIYTQLDENDDVVLLGCYLRISVFSEVDNMAAGNLAAPVDVDTGVIASEAVYSDITKAPEQSHPLTKERIVGFQVPFWKECVTLAKSAALHNTTNRSIGWDIVVTEDGPGLIEGNHDWCKLVWQLPLKKGMKKMIEKYV